MATKNMRVGRVFYKDNIVIMIDSFDGETYLKRKKKVTIFISFSLVVFPVSMVNRYVVTAGLSINSLKSQKFHAEEKYPIVFSTIQTYFDNKKWFCNNVTLPSDFLVESNMSYYDMYDGNATPF